MQSMFNKEDQIYFHNLVGNMRKAIIDIIATVEWLDDDTRLLVTETVENLVVYDGYPSMYNNESALVEYYKQVKNI